MCNSPVTEKIRLSLGSCSNTRGSTVIIWVSYRIKVIMRDFLFCWKSLGVGDFLKQKGILSIILTSNNVAVVYSIIMLSL